MPTSPTQYRPTPSSQDRHAYIPAGMGEVMTQKIQQSLPSSLKKYVSSGSNGYMPQHVEKALTEHMQKTLPAHMQKYASAYVHQNIVAPGMRGAPAASRPMVDRPPVPNPLRKDHSASVPTEQHEVQFHNNLFASDAAHKPSTPPPAPPPVDLSGAAKNRSTSSRPNGESPYDFFLKDQLKPKKGLNLGGGSFAKRLLIMVGGGLVLLIFIIIFISMVFGGGKGQSQQLLELAQEQTEIVRIADIGVTKARGSAAKNLATTVKYSVSSSLNEVLGLIGKKPRDKSLTLKKNSVTDQTLETAAINNNFDEVFTQTLQTSLKAYQANTKTIYDSTSVQKQKDALSNAYNGITALLETSTTQSN